MVRRAVAILVSVWCIALGAGVLEHLHNAQHRLEDARAAEPSGVAPRDGGEKQSPPDHNENNCPVHALLHAPVASLTCPLPSLLPGPCSPVVDLPAPPLSPRSAPARIDCRGPPSS